MRITNAIEYFHKGIDRQGEEIDAGHAARRAAAQQVWFQRSKPPVAQLQRISKHLSNAALARSGEHALLLPMYPIFNVQMHGVLSGHVPGVERFEAAMNIVGRIVRSLEGRMINGSEEVEDMNRIVAIDAGFVFVNES